jgi:hypothetical protein
VEHILRELKYCAFKPGFRFSTGDIAEAQTAALEQGWLVRCPSDPSLLAITPAGRVMIQQLEG